MPVPTYKGFTKDMKEVYEAYAATSFTEGGEAAGKWQNVMSAMKALTEGATDEKWRTYIDSLNACRNRTIDELTDRSKLPQEKQAWLDEYNKNYNDNEDDVAEQEKWTLHRLMNRLLRSTKTMMDRQEALEQDEKDIDEYLKEYDGVSKYIDKIGSDFDKFKDYEDFSVQAENAIEQRKKLETKLKDAPEGHLSEEENEKNLETLLKLHKEYYGADTVFEKQLDEIDGKIKTQKKVELAAKEEMETVQKNAEKIEEEAKKEEQKLEEEKEKRQQQLERTLKEKEKVVKVSDELVNMHTQQHQVENDLKDVDKRYQKTKGFTGFARGVRGIFNKKIREEDKKAKEDHAIKSTIESIEGAGQLTEQVKAFKGKFEPDDNFSDMMSLGNYMANKAKPQMRQQLIEANKHNARSLKLYQEQQALVKTMRADFAKYKPDQAEWNKFDERMKTPEGMIKMAEELTELQKQQLSQLRDEIGQDSVNQIENKFVQKRMNQEFINNTEKVFEGMQSGLKAETNRLSVTTMAVKQQADEVKKAGLEAKLTTPIDNYQKEVKKRKDLEQEYAQCSSKREENREKLNEVSAKCRILEETIDDQKHLKEYEERVKKFNDIGKKLRDFREKANGLAASGERLKNEKLKIDSNGRFGKRYTDGAVGDIYFGLKNLYETALIGKKPGHSDTKSYRGMMDGFDKLIAGGEGGLKGKSPEEVKEILSGLKAGAENYITVKKGQSFQSWRHSPMRKARLNFAEELIKMCDEGTKQIGKVGTRIKSVQDKYDECCKPVVQNWAKKLTVSEAMDVIKVNRKAALQNEASKKKSGPELSAH